MYRCNLRCIRINGSNHYGCSWDFLVHIYFTFLDNWFRFYPPSPWRTVSLGSGGSSVPGWLLQGPRRPSGWKAQRNSKSLSWSRTKEQFQRVNADALLVSVIDVFPVPMQQCVEFFLKSDKDHILAMLLAASWFKVAVKNVVQRSLKIIA